MKKLLFCTLAIFFLAGAIHANPDAILGTWWNAEKDSRFDIYKCGSKYCAKVTWMKEPEKLDKENPNASLRNRKIMGLQFMSGFTYDADDKEWDDGTIYNPRDGKTYSCYMELKNPTTLNVTGYVGVKWLSKTAVWTRFK